MASETTAGRICEDIDRLEREGTPFEAVLTHAVQQLHESNPVFDWTGVYELHLDDVLRLGPFVGAPTDHVFIAVGNGVCGEAIAQKRNINVPDVSKASNYLACSASTRSELVVLIRLGETIFGQIDIDSHQPHAFSDDLVCEVQTLADRLALSYLRQTGQES
jgi:GAF domain-containing protein